MQRQFFFLKFKFHPAKPVKQDLKDDICQISKRAKVSKIICRFSRFFKICRNYPVTPQYPGTPKKSHLGSKRLPNTPSGNPGGQGGGWTGTHTSRKVTLDLNNIEVQGGGDNKEKNGGFLNINPQGTCKYYEINEFQEKSKDFSTFSNFSTLSLNVRSLKN